METKWKKMRILIYAEPCGVFRKASIYAQRNAGDICAQIHSTKEENAKNQVTMSQLMGFTCDQFKRIHGKGEVGDKESNLLEQKLVELSKVISAKTVGEVETNAQTIDMGGSKMEKGVDSRNLRPSGKSEV